MQEVISAMGKTTQAQHKEKVWNKQVWVESLCWVLLENVLMLGHSRAQVLISLFILVSLLSSSLMVQCL